MNCSDWQERIPEFLRGEGASADRADWELHRAACGACRAEWESLGEVWGLLGQASAGPGPAFRERALAALASEGRNIHAVPRIPLLRRPMLLAGAALLVLGVGFGAGSLAGGGRRPGPDRPPYALLRDADAGGRMTGVALLSQGGPRSADTADALLDLVEGDPAPKVRLAALEALYLFGDRPGVVERLARSLPRQASPRVQAAQVELLLAIREKRALEALHALLRDPALDAGVRRQIQAGLGQRDL